MISGKGLGALRLLGGFILLAATAAPAHAERIAVVATFSVLGDMVKQIGGDEVAVTTLVGPDGDAHVFQPSPADAGAVAKARLLIMNGLGFEGWMERLLEATRFKGVVVTATEGIEPLRSDEEDDHGSDSHKDQDGHGKESEKHEHDRDGHDKEHKDREHSESDKSAEHSQEEGHAKADHHGHHHGADDPHAWHDPTHAQIYARNIARGLSAVDPANSAYYDARLASYVKEIAALDAEIEATLSRLPAKQRTVITSHDALQYFGHAYGLTFLAPQGLSTESEASAEDVARLIRQIRAQAITAVFVQNLGDPRLVKQIAAETGATIGGTLHTDALSPADGPAATYLQMLRSNARVLYNALKD